MGESPDATPPEALLQAVWFHQRLLRHSLRLLDGRPVRILHPGFWNHEAGPDFRSAIVQIAEEAPRVGDIEIDLVSQGWHQHGHDRNPNYAGVILHIVWDGDSRNSLPTLALKSYLDAPLDHIVASLGKPTERHWPLELTGQCTAPLQLLDETKRHELLRQAAMVRLQSKAAQLEARARQAGWDQALWEGLFRALGYKNNVWPLQRLAEIVPYPAQPDANHSNVLGWQARLLGIGNLLPPDLTRQSVVTDDYLRRVWDHWWRERDDFASIQLPRAIWRFNGLRPANHPQRRIALASHWLATAELPLKLQSWFTSRIPDKRLPSTLLEALQPADDEYWSSHWTLNSARMPQPQPLLGGTRVTDLAINVILPWLWVRAVCGRNDELQRIAEHRYFVWPAGEDNSVLRQARQRLLAGAPPRSLQSAAMQQGLLQIVRDFCEHSNALCENCPFPELVRSAT